MRRSTEQRATAPVGMGGGLSLRRLGAAFGLTAAAVAAPLATAASVMAPIVGAAAVIDPEGVKKLGEKLNIGAHSDDWKSWANGGLEILTMGASESGKVREAVKRLGEQWNVGNNSMDTLKSLVNVASIASSLTGVGTLASALLGSSTMTQGAMTIAREYAREELKNRIVGKVGQELADPYIDHLVKKARRDRMALNAQEQELLSQYREARPGVYEVLLKAVENPNALDAEEMQLVVNYQRDVEDERALVMNKPEPPDEEWPAYYTRFLAEYGVTWKPTERPGVVKAIGGGLPPTPTERVVLSLDDYTAMRTMGSQPRTPMSLTFSPELKNALDSLYPKTR